MTCERKKKEQRIITLFICSITLVRPASKLNKKRFFRFNFPLLEVSQLFFFFNCDKQNTLLLYWINNWNYIRHRPTCALVLWSLWVNEVWHLLNSNHFNHKFSSNSSILLYLPWRHELRLCMCGSGNIGVIFFCDPMRRASMPS